MADPLTPTPDDADALPAVPALALGFAALAEAVERGATAFYEEHRLTPQNTEALLIARAMRRVASALREAGSGPSVGSDG